MKRTELVVAICIALASISSQAQAQDSAKSPELQKLDAFVGMWAFEWDAQDSVVGPAGKITGTEEFQWLPGGRFLQMRRTAEGVAGSFQNLALFGYDQNSQLYTQSVFNLSDGWRGVLSGPESNLS